MSDTPGDIVFISPSLAPEARYGLRARAGGEPPFELFGAGGVLFFRQQMTPAPFFVFPVPGTSGELFDPERSALRE